MWAGMWAGSNKCQRYRVPSRIDRTHRRLSRVAALPRCYNLFVLDDLLLPLFPLECVLLPEELLPLHIFEERYKQMIGACLEAQERGSGQQQFGIVLAKEGDINTVGCSARVVKVIRKYEDGRMDILAQGTRRFEVFLTNEEEPYLRGGVEFFDDDEGADLPNETDAAHAVELFTKIRDLLGNPAEIPADLPRPHKNLSFRIAAPLPLDLDFKQQLLSVRNETQRLRDVARAIQQLVPRLTALRRAQQKAGGNGRAR
jgi:Lon protease-like protein